MGCQLRAPEPSVTLVNSVKLGTFQVQKSKIAQKDGSEMIGAGFLAYRLGLCADGGSSEMTFFVMSALGH
jgi:hypothetical protein